MSRGHCRAVKPAGQVQPLDTVHGLAGMGESLSQMWYKGSRGSHLTSQHGEGSGPTQPRETMMIRYYDGRHGFYAGVDLHARTLHLCVLDAKGQVVQDVNVPANPDAFLRAIAAYRADLVVGCECMFCWYWLADLCEQEKVRLVVGHAYYMRLIHGAKAKNDRIDANKIARL